MKYKIQKFKDGQVAAKILEEGNLEVHIRGNSYEDLFAIAAIKEAWDADNAMNKTATATLTIYCLIGQRSDRRFNAKESFDLKVIANFINSMNFGADLVPSNKVRVDGVPQISIQGNVKDKDCLIVDDLADGGRTFKFLAEALKNQGAAKVFLYVTHGQFNYGFDELKETIDHVYCTNSYKDIEDVFVTQFKVI